METKQPPLTSSAPQSDELAEQIELVNNDASSDVILDSFASPQNTDLQLRLAKDGRTILVPQPTSDPNDPINWSSFRKHMILFIAGWGAFCSDFISSAGVPCIIVQGKEWNMDPAKVNYAGNLNVLMLAIGSILWTPIIYFWGRAPALLWSTVLGTAFTLGSAVATDFPTYYAMRALTGLTLTFSVATGLTVVKEMFFFHEHARKIGIWAAMFLLAPYLGASLGNFIVGTTGQWRPVLWMCFGMDCFLLVLVLAFADETFYDRSMAREQQPSRGSRMMRVIGLWQIRNHSYFHTLWESVVRLVKVFVRPPVILIMIYYALTFMWAIGINITSSILFSTPKSQGGYGFSSITVGYTYFAPIVGVSIGELFGHFFNDYVANRYIRKNKGHFRPEARLWTNYIGAVVMVPGLIMVGLALEQQLSPAIVVIGWGMYVLGVMVASVAITAYALDSYPQASGELCALINVARTGCGFATGYFQQPWGQAQGYAVSFGIQAAFVGLSTIILVVLHLHGHKLRLKGGQLDLGTHRH